jgi:hypothetical protein
MVRVKQMVQLKVFAQSELGRVVEITEEDVALEELRERIPEASPNALLDLTAQI